MIVDLTGMEIANASLLDEATAAAEGMTMAHRVAKSKSATFFVAHDCHPQTIAVVQTRARPLGIEVVVGDPAKDLDGRVIVTGCMGKEAETIRARFPRVLAVTGAHQYEEVVGAVHDAAPMPPNAFLNLVPESGLKLTPRHYSYLKISEGCNHRCAFCIIPSLRGAPVSRSEERRVGKECVSKVSSRW